MINSIISEWLAKGAKTFIVKPLRLQEVRGFESFMNEEYESEGELNLRKYEVVHNLGHGAAGSVDLVRNLDTGNLYALKTIALSNLNAKEKESAESEMHFLKVLKGPTLIKSYQSYFEKEKILIFMEYAEGGTLADKILEYKLNGEWFDTSTILNWIAQIVLGVMLMHSKNILHRDLKSQNLFLTSDGTIKIGDFGISKELPTLDSLARTSWGTPYFMPPEVCKGEPYGEKIDIWAIGCILYELVFFRKPFESKTIYGVFEKIINKPLDNTYEDVDSEIKILLLTLLDKDPSRRPSIWELANTPWIHKYINHYVQEKGCHAEVATVFEWDKGKDPLDETQTRLADPNLFDAGRLDIITHFIRLDIPLGDCKNGWFSSVKNWGSGYDILKWMCDKVEADEDRARMLCQKMMDYAYITKVDGEGMFLPTNTPMYQFYEDRDDLAANMLRPFKDKVESAVEVSYELVKIIEEVYREAIVEIDGVPKIIAEKALMSKQYEQYIWVVSKLEHVVLNFYSVGEAYCFFMNIYQWFYVHWFLKELKPHQNENEESGSLFNNLRGLMGSTNKKQDMFYLIGGHNYTIDELKHGVLRGNRKKPGAILKTLNSNDPRAQFIPEDHYDLRVLFLWLDIPQTMEHISWFSDPDKIDENFDPFLREFFGSKVRRN
jgi:serine/threonine protein kinase